ncbi:MAG: hypothetical protein OXG44_05675 [Gammaproteobacteria bacterium]|nr:hypothetical protein [Gammaproteobacteria bacterium]
MSFEELNFSTREILRSPDATRTGLNTQEVVVPYLVDTRSMPVGCVDLAPQICATVLEHLAQLPIGFVQGGYPFGIASAAIQVGHRGFVMNDTQTECQTKRDNDP